jgi:EmrB/QacA subfamily drug resistance transporter
VTETGSTVPAEKQAGSGIERKWWTLIAVSGATFMLLVDVTIVQVALPTIQRHLHSSFTDLEWVIDAYALALATLLLTWGSLADRFGRKRVFITGLSVFTISSLLCGLANSSPFLIWSRAAQGVGGAAMFATGLALIGQEFRGRDRGTAIAVWGATVGVAVAVGPLIGGALTQALGWQYIFFVNVPVGVIVVAIAVVYMSNVRDPDSRRTDIAGLVTFAGSCFFLVLALLRGNADGWTSSLILGLFAGSALLMVAFVVVELRQKRPMFDLSLFRKPSFTGVSAGTFAIGAGMFALYPYLTLFLQNDLGYSPLAGGLRMLPSTIPCFVVPLLARNVAERIPPGPLLGIGLGTTALGIGLMYGLSADSAWTALVPGLVLTGVGIGIANPAIGRTALGVVRPERSGMASGISNTFRIGGLATGVAALGAIFQNRISSSIGSQDAAIVVSGGVRAGAANIARSHPGLQAALPEVRSAFTAGMNEILLIGMAVVAVGTVVVLMLVRAKDFVALPAPPAATPTTEAPAPGGPQGARPGGLEGARA